MTRVEAPHLNDAAAERHVSLINAHRKRDKRLSLQGGSQGVRGYCLECDTTERFSFHETAETKLLAYRRSQLEGGHISLDLSEFKAEILTNESSL